MNEIRNGRITSSEIFRIMKPGKAKGSWSVDADTYIEECNNERRMLRSIEVEVDAKPLTWGKCCERRAFDIMGTEYTLCSDITLQHPDIPYWVGSPDATTEVKVGDLKCPKTLTSFCQMVAPYRENGKIVHEALSIEALRENHKDGDKFFWQVVSNGILTKKKKGQIVVYVPFEDELDEIRRLAEGIPEYYWIFYAANDALPYLKREGFYKNLNVIEFDILQRDVDALTNRVLECGEKLIPYHTNVTEQ